MTFTRIHNKIIEVLGLDVRNMSPKGWILGAQCPFCESDEKFGVKLNVPTSKYTNHVSYNCYRGSCQSKGGEYLLFKQLGIESFLIQGPIVKLEDKLEDEIETHLLQQRLQVDISVPTVHPPIGFKRCYSNEYLRSRGFEDWQFELYVIGETKLMTKFREYIIFLITEDGCNKGYVARSYKEKEWIESHNKQIKQYNKKVPKDQRKPLYLRYINEGKVDFAKLLFGIDQITSFTIEVIVVEGITDKAQIDRWLNKRDLDQIIVCFCTFGKKMSEEQIIKMLTRIPKLVKVTFMYDPDAIDQSKQYANYLSQYKPELIVNCCFLDCKDPGDLSYDELDQVWNNAESVSAFSLNKVQVLSLG